VRLLFGLVLVLSICLAGCGGVAVTNHEPPAVPTPDGALVSAADEQCPPAEGGRRQCDPSSPLGAPEEEGGMGCDVISLPHELLGALDPPYPLLVCEIHPALHGDDMVRLMEELRTPGAYLFWGGGLWPVYTRYVIQDAGGFRLLRSQRDLQQAYAPIESPDEALAYAMAATGLDARFGLRREGDLAYAVEALEDTCVRETDQGYAVLLYQDQAFGCGPHWTSAVEVLVEPDGSYSTARTWNVYRDPAMDDVCVD